MQTTSSDTNDIFSRTDNYSLENMTKDKLWVRLADSLDWEYVDEELTSASPTKKCGASNRWLDEGTIISIK